ncbi:hypothetical protein [Microcoleus phage My-WqHQDG]|nr:hypothetical protein [Microcoleus phage My-WqHQDG]
MGLTSKLTTTTRRIMRTYYRTLIQVEGVSLRKYNPNSIYDVVQDKKYGPYVAEWSVKEYGVATTEQVEALTLKRYNPKYKHYKHDITTPDPTTTDCDSTYYRTVVEIEVLTKSEYEVKDLTSLEYDMLSGHCLGVWGIKVCRPCIVASSMEKASDSTGPSTNLYLGPVEVDYWNMQQDNYQDKVAFLTNHNKEELVAAIMSYHYNAFCEDNCDADTLPNVPAGSIGQIPYIGWWRDIDFCGRVPIGMMSTDNGTIIGFMGNNKWDYPERELTDDERMKVISYLDRAMCRISKDAREGILKELWNYMQTLEIS